MTKRAMECVIPHPVSVTFTSGSFALKDLRAIRAEEGLERFEGEALDLCRAFGIKASVVNEDVKEGLLYIRKDPSLAGEAFVLTVEEKSITLKGGDDAGLFYGLSALGQIFCAASCSGPLPAKIECGVIEDSPRFAWRSFMLDSARHFQSKETVKRIIRLLAAYRINVFHWHLTDSQGWRIAMDSVERKASSDAMSEGFYTREEIREIVEYAKSYFIQIVPEVDVPGHSKGFLAAYKQFACDGMEPGKEFCLGKPEVMEQLKKIFAELLEIFPESRYIHFGGDEADTTHWEQCPHCRKAMKDLGFSNMRQLENHFMVNLTRFAIEKGRIPIVWGTDTPFPADTVIQNWSGNIREPFPHVENGNPIIISFHTSYYFDYPANSAEPHETWMFGLPEESIYMADPFVIWEKEWKESMLGPEACLWTETVPQWRVWHKIQPRLAAYSEVVWSLPQHKDYAIFRERKELLKAAGYEEYLASL